MSPLKIRDGVRGAGDAGRGGADWRRIAVTVGGALFLVFAVAGSAWGYWIFAGRFATVEEGVLYRSARMSPEQFVELCERHGIRTVVNLQKAEESGDPGAEAEALTAAGIRYIHLPTGQVPPPDVVEGFLAIMRDTDHHPVLVHCEHGVGRTGVMSALYRMEFAKWPLERALREARMLSGFDSFETGTSKEVFLREYASGVRAEDAGPPHVGSRLR